MIARVRRVSLWLDEGGLYEYFSRLPARCDRRDATTSHDCLGIGLAKHDAFDVSAEVRLFGGDAQLFQIGMDLGKGKEDLPVRVTKALPVDGSAEYAAAMACAS